MIEGMTDIQKMRAALCLDMNFVKIKFTYLKI
jgi:hypothetical protein